MLALAMAATARDMVLPTKLPRAAALLMVLASPAAAVGAPVTAAVKQQCMHPAPASGLSRLASEYHGTWYEIGKIQTAGGAFFESACVCTQLVVDTSTKPSAEAGDASVLNSCRDKTPAGKFINATAQLVNMAPPGHWDETFVPKAFGVFVNYTVIMQGTDPLTEEQYVAWSGWLPALTCSSHSRTPHTILHGCRLSVVRSAAIESAVVVTGTRSSTIAQTRSWVPTTASTSWAASQQCQRCSWKSC